MSGETPAEETNPSPFPQGQSGKEGRICFETLLLSALPSTSQFFIYLKRGLILEPNKLEHILVQRLSFLVCFDVLI